MGTISGLTFGSARSSYGNETRGDQRQTSNTNDTDGEVCMQEAYYPIHDQMPHVYRPINADYATTMAQCMITFCNNKNVGYSMNIGRSEVVTYGPNTTQAINGDCSATVRACIKWATGKDPGDFYTGDEGSVLNSTGLFQYMGQYTTGMTLYNGDVLYGRTGDSGHTGIIVKGRPREGQSDTELAGGVTTTDGTAYDAGTGMSIAKTSINTEVLNQYVLTIDRNTPNPDYETMLKNRVGGVIIEAGYLYNSQHTVVSNPRNPYIQQQCTSAVAAGMPYGLYWDVKARSEDEAKSELYQLQFIIRKYPPVMGIWLHLELTKSKTTNNKIVDIYAQELEILGLKGYKGFYVTAEELEKIDWDDYQEDWWLWIVNHVDNASEVDSLLEPYFFTISGEPGSAAANPDYNAGSSSISAATVGTGTLTSNSSGHKTVSEYNGFYLNDDNNSSGRLLVGNSRTIQLYEYNGYEYYSNASFVAVWGGNYYTTKSYSINSTSRVSTMKTYIKESIQNKGSCRVFVCATVNDYDGGSSYQSPAKNVASLAKTLSGVTATYSGKTLAPTVYVLSLIGSKGKSVTNYNNYLSGLASSYNFTFMDISGCMSGSNSGYQNDNVHFNNDTLKNIWNKLA